MASPPRPFTRRRASRSGPWACIRLELFHAVENAGSCRVAESAGLRLEGVHRSSYRYGDGLLHDEHCHARLADDPVAG